MNPAVLYAIQALTQLLGLVPAATAAWQQVQATRNKLEQFQAEKRDPTPEEWAALSAQTADLLKQLNS